MNTTIFISVISLSFCCFIFFYFKWYINRRISAMELINEYRTEVNRLIAEIDLKTDRDSQLVEERIKKLKAILEDTDKRIAVYGRELERGRSGAALYTSLGRGIQAALKTSAAQSAAEKPADAPPAALPGAPPSAIPAGQLREQLEALIGQGVPVQEIAARLDISLAEVDLALNLFGSRANQA